MNEQFLTAVSREHHNFLPYEVGYCVIFCGIGFFQKKISFTVFLLNATIYFYILCRRMNAGWKHSYLKKVKILQLIDCFVFHWDRKVAFCSSTSKFRTIHTYAIAVSTKTLIRNNFIDYTDFSVLILSAHVKNDIWGQITNNQ